MPPAKGAALPAANPARHPAPRACPPDEPCLRIAVWPPGGGYGALAQALLGLAAEPLDAVQQRKSGQRSGVLGRRPVEEEKNEKRDASQHGEPCDCNTPFPGRLRSNARSLAHASRIALAALLRGT